jgi:iron complex outermembrane receptor protein
MIRYFFVVFLCVSSLASAQLNLAEPVAIDSITVSTNRIELPFSDNSRSIQIITKEQLAQAPVISIAQALQYAAGVDVRQRGVHGVQSDISIRGGTFDQVLILINGVKVIDPQTGHHLMNLPIDIQQVERIEILKGPGARIQGQNAFAGAINIITKVPDELFLQAGLQLGENGLYGVRLTTALPGKVWKNMLSFSHDASKGYRHNTDYRITNAFYQSEIKLGKSSLGIDAGYTARTFGANGFYASPAFTEQFEMTQTSLIALRYRAVAGNWLLKPNLYWRRNRDEYIFIRSNPDVYRNVHVSQNMGAELHASYQSKLGYTGLGLEGNYVSLSSNNLGERKRFTTTAFAEHRFSLLNQSLDITPGVALNYYSDFGFRAFPGIDLGYRFNPRLKTFVNVGYTYRIPTYTDLYYQDAANIGNADLKPESALTAEWGLKYQTRVLSAQMAVFRRDGQDAIDWVKDSLNAPWQPQNFSRVVMNGAEFVGQVNFKALDIPVLRTLDLNYTFLNGAIKNQETALSRYALDNLRHQLTAGLDLQLWKNLWLNNRVRYCDRVNLDDYMLWDAKLMWRSKWLQVFVNASNVLGTQYTETNLVPMPGRWITAGITLKGF